MRPTVTYEHTHTMLAPPGNQVPVTMGSAAPTSVRQTLKNSIRHKSKGSKPNGKLKPVGTPTSDEEDFSTTAIKVNVIAEVNSPTSDDDSRIDDFADAIDDVKGESRGKSTDEEAVALRRERNRLAAQRCRQRRRDRIDKLELVCSKLSSDGSILEQEVAEMEQELLKLQNILQNHDCVQTSHSSMTSLSQNDVTTILWPQQQSQPTQTGGNNSSEVQNRTAQMNTLQPTLGSRSHESIWVSQPTHLHS